MIDLKLILDRLRACAAPQRPAGAMSLEQVFDQTPVQTMERLINSWRGRDPTGLSARVIDALSRDRRFRVRERAAALIGEVVARDCGPLGRHAEQLLAKLVCDPISVVRATAKASVARLLEGLYGTRRSQLVAAWSSSSEPRIRAAVARALPRRQAGSAGPRATRRRRDARRERRLASTKQPGEPLFPR
jgi:hypothetical protein